MPNFNKKFKHKTCYYLSIDQTEKCGIFFRILTPSAIHAVTSFEDHIDTITNRAQQ